MRSIILSGGGFVNKGAQAMTLICICELQKRYPEHQLYLLTWNAGDSEKIRHENYRIKLLQIPPLKFSCAAHNHLRKHLYSVRYRRTFTEADEIYRSTDLFIDISGYALGSNWSAKICNDYLDNIEHALAYEIPVYLFPQSFGPFDWRDEEGKRIDQRIRRLFPRIRTICAREEEGYRALVNQYGLEDNTIQCKDMVLTSRLNDYSPALKHKNEGILPEIEENSVCVIPNVRIAETGIRNPQEIYCSVIRELLAQDITVYLLYHSSQDRELCLELKDKYEEDERVVFLDNDFSCIEFNELVRKFNFVIASRFHALVHALKNGVPCIALGWAVKYVELMKLFGQERYVFDLSQEVDIPAVTHVVREMSQKWKRETNNILEALPELQKENVFDSIERL